MRFLMRRGIDAFLERLDADAVDGIDESLVGAAAFDVGFKQARDDVRRRSGTWRCPDTER
jgi:hypothetical protein